ncbi:hypothetical protein B0H16DRAFT_1537192 [Mycena metata]|uniref:Uncharacterized protein n=1 Tax=Mycena metata TaxID=1033252 RepID=A0AAD7NDN0_9AGAR|nr:hypothetical protein B0H16DRAFT_1537192 [Mycena metata]
MKCGALPEYVQKLVDFRLRTARESVRWMRSIPSETLEKARVPYTHSSTEGLDEQVIARMMVFFSMRSMDNALIELKSWLCLFYQVDDWLLRWNYYQLRVDRRHAESHLICPAEWILREMSLPSSFATDSTFRKLFTIPPSFITTPPSSFAQSRFAFPAPLPSTGGLHLRLIYLLNTSTALNSKHLAPPHVPA